MTSQPSLLSKAAQVWTSASQPCATRSSRSCWNCRSSPCASPRRPCARCGATVGMTYGGGPKWLVEKGKSQSKMDYDWGYPYFRTLPYFLTVCLFGFVFGNWFNSCLGAFGFFKKKAPFGSPEVCTIFRRTAVKNGSNGMVIDANVFSTKQYKAVPPRL